MSLFPPPEPVIDPTGPLQPGTMVRVKSWWWPDNRIVECKVERDCGIINGTRFFDVRPTAAGAHGRFIKANLIQS